MNSGCTDSAAGPSLSIAPAIDCKSVGHTSEQYVKPK